MPTRAPAKGRRVQEGGTRILPRIDPTGKSPPQVSSLAANSGVARVPLYPECKRKGLKSMTSVLSHYTILNPTVMGFVSIAGTVT